MKKLIITIGILFAVQVSAASLIQYDDVDAIVPGRVISYKESGDQTAYSNDVNDYGQVKDGYLINTDLSAVDGVVQKYWKVADGVVVEMSEDEKDDIDVLFTPTVDPIDELIDSADADDDDAADQASGGVGGFAALVAFFGGSAGGAALALSKKNAKRIKVLEDK